MRRISKILLFIFLISSVFACYDVIEVDLDDANPRPVIDAQLFNEYRPAMVVLSKSTAFFGTPEFEFISDAEIELTDDLGNSVTFMETDSSGVYMANYNGSPGRAYSLKVTTDEGEYKAQSTMQESLRIDSLSVISLNQEFGIPGEDLGLYCHFTNPPGQPDYLQFRLYKNFEPMPALYLMDDFYIDGRSFDFFFYSDFTEANDTLIVEMLTMDANVYDYLYTLSEVAGSSGTGAGTPYNPNTNLSNGALGYFGAFGIDIAMIIAEEGAVTIPDRNSPVYKNALKRIRDKQKSPFGLN
jgi:hypothetical protein